MSTRSPGGTLRPARAQVGLVHITRRTRALVNEPVPRLRLAIRASYSCPTGLRHQTLRCDPAPNSSGEASSEWHPTRNDVPNAADITAGSHRGVSWECAACADEFRARTRSRSLHLASMQQADSSS
ncbi:zinc-ribbon domain-containing protein [Streptomyces sp. NPDC005500]|uniref:zinc-ribbon domain-containing protein n=1 Tax=Streptomyces sp. NPDC005500 TaxID=3155007 RepID=UPI0033A3DFB7